MKKQIKNLFMSVLLIGMFSNGQWLINIMKGIDAFGYAFNIPTIEVIDGLNELYYSLGYK